MEQRIAWVQGLSSEGKRAINGEHQAAYTRAMRDVEKMRGKIVESLEEKGVTHTRLEETFIPLEEAGISECSSELIHNARTEADIALITKLNTIAGSVPAGYGYPKDFLPD